MLNVNLGRILPKTPPKHTLLAKVTCCSGSRDTGQHIFTQYCSLRRKRKSKVNNNIKTLKLQNYSRNLHILRLEVKLEARLFLSPAGRLWGKNALRICKRYPVLSLAGHDQEKYIYIWWMNCSGTCKAHVISQSFNFFRLVRSSNLCPFKLAERHMSNSELFAPSLGLPKYIYRLTDQQINKTDLSAFQCLGRASVCGCHCRHSVLGPQDAPMKQ